MADENSATVLQDGQLAVATVAQTGEIVSNPSEIDTTAVVQTESGKQLCVKTVSVGGGGGGGSSTAWGSITGTLSDQTDLKNALDTKLQNKATGSNSLSILGPTTPALSAILIGANVTGNYCSYSVSIGDSSAVNNAVNCVAIGHSAQSIADGATALGNGAKANASYSIQLGEGTNSTSNTLQVWDKPLLDKTTGKIPAERIPDTLLKNTATQDSSLTVDGTASSAYYATNVGKLSEATSNNAVAVGRYARASGNSAIAIGSGTTASALNAVSVSPGGKASGENSIQLGYGTNSTANSFQVWDKPMLDKTSGLIPLERLGTGYDATKTQVLKHINGVATWVDEN